jgi:hypothetical protein
VKTITNHQWSINVHCQKFIGLLLVSLGEGEAEFFINPWSWRSMWCRVYVSPTESSWMLHPLTIDLSLIGAMLSRPRPMCPCTKSLGCTVSWTVRPVDDASLTDGSLNIETLWPYARLGYRLASSRSAAGHTNIYWWVSVMTITLMHIWDRVRTHRSGKERPWAHHPRDTLCKGLNVLDFLSRDTSVGDKSSRHHNYVHQHLW